MTFGLFQTETNHECSSKIQLSTTMFAFNIKYIGFRGIAFIALCIAAINLHFLLPSLVPTDPSRIRISKRPPRTLRLKHVQRMVSFLVPLEKEVNLADKNTFMNYSTQLPRIRLRLLNAFLSNSITGKKLRVCFTGGSNTAQNIRVFPWKLHPKRKPTAGTTWQPRVEKWMNKLLGEDNIEIFDASKVCNSHKSMKLRITSQRNEEEILFPKVNTFYPAL